MNSRREISFSSTASINLFECLVMSGAPAVGFLHAATFRDVRALQMSLQLLRDMWKTVDGLYIPKLDLESLHAMECKTAGSHVTDIPPCIAVDMKKLARYYVYLLFRYCVSAAEHGSGTDRSHKTPALHLTDIPTTWMQTVVSTNYPSAPPMFTHSASDVYQQQQHHQQHQQQQPSGMTQMNIGQQQQVPLYAAHHAPPDRVIQSDGVQQRHSQPFHNITGASQKPVFNQPRSNKKQQHQQQPTSSHALYPELPSNQLSTEKRPQITKRVVGPYQSGPYQSEESDQD